MGMTQMELFAGIGGFGLAGRWAGIESVVQVEWNKYCQKILKKNFPNAALYSDIREFDGTPYRGAIDIISGGFPCQPYSTAGKRLGKADDRHLWPEMLRVIREVAPRWVVGENVRGLVSWSGGLVFDEVQADLEASGYEVFAAILPAASVNAPHRRDRIWFVAYTNQSNAGRNNRSGEIQGTAEAIKGAEQGQNGERLRARLGNVSETTANAKRLQGRNGYKPSMQRRWSENSKQIGVGSIGFCQWQQFPTQSPVCGGNDGVPNRVDRIAALGNAIVPQVAYQIFKAIIEYENGYRTI